MNTKININKQTDALIIIDLQNDFCPGGALAVKEGHDIVDGVIQLSTQFKHIVLTQDWHPEGHSSFASSYKDKQPFSTIYLEYGQQTLWPDHCIQGSHGAQFVEKLKSSDLMNKSQLIIRKGMNKQIDSYSAFFENDQSTSTGLGGYLKEKGIQRVFFVGLAYDFCVAFSALDAKVKVGLDSVIIKDLCKAIKQPLEQTDKKYPDNTEDMMEVFFKEKGVQVINQENLVLDFICDQTSTNKKFKK